jgi:hypothetical protein
VDRDDRRLTKTRTNVSSEGTEREIRAKREEDEGGAWRAKDRRDEARMSFSGGRRETTKRVITEV